MICPHCLLDLDTGGLRWLCPPSCDARMAGDHPGRVEGDARGRAGARRPDEQWAVCHCGRVATRHKAANCDLPLLHETAARPERVRHAVIMADPTRAEAEADKPEARLLAGRLRLAFAGALADGLRRKAAADGALMTPSAWSLAHWRVVRTRGLRLAGNRDPALIEARAHGESGTLWALHAWPLQATPEGCWRLTATVAGADERLKNADTVILPVPARALHDPSAARDVLARVDALRDRKDADALWLCHLDPEAAVRDIFGQAADALAATPATRRSLEPSLGEAAWRWIVRLADPNRSDAEAPGSVFLWADGDGAQERVWPNDPNAAGDSPCPWGSGGLDAWVAAEIEGAHRPALPDSAPEKVKPGPGIISRVLRDEAGKIDLRRIGGGLRALAAWFGGAPFLRPRQIGPALKGLAKEGRNADENQAGANTVARAGGLGLMAVLAVLAPGAEMQVFALMASVLLAVLAADDWAAFAPPPRGFWRPVGVSAALAALTGGLLVWTLDAPVWAIAALLGGDLLLRQLRAVVQDMAHGDRAHQLLRGLGWLFDVHAGADRALAAFAARFARAFLLPSVYGFRCPHCGMDRPDVQARAPAAKPVDLRPTPAVPLIRDVGGMCCPLYADLNSWAAQPPVAAKVIYLHSPSCAARGCYGASTTNTTTAGASRVLVLAADWPTVTRVLIPALAALAADGRAPQPTHLSGSSRYEIARAGGGPGMQVDVLVPGTRHRRPSVLGYRRCILLHPGSVQAGMYKMLPDHQVVSLLAALSVPRAEPAGTAEVSESDLRKRLRYLLVETPIDAGGAAAASPKADVVVMPALAAGDPALPRGLQPEQAPDAKTALDQV